MWADSWTAILHHQEPRERKAGSLQIRRSCLPSDATVRVSLGPIARFLEAIEAIEHVFDNSLSAQTKRHYQLNKTNNNASTSLVNLWNLCEAGPLFLRKQDHAARSPLLFEHFTDSVQPGLRI